jgi:SAM-dependent methyltransferase
MDGQALEFDAAEFDVAGCGLGLMFFPDPPKALREMRRVVKPGGRIIVTTTGLTATTTGLRATSDLMTLMAQSMAAATGGTVPTSPPAPSLQQPPGSLAEQLSDAGFSDVRVETVEGSWPVSNPNEFWTHWLLDSPLTAAAMRALRRQSKKLPAANSFDFSTNGASPRSESWPK